MKALLLALFLLKEMSMLILLAVNNPRFKLAVIKDATEVILEICKLYSQPVTKKGGDSPPRT